MIKTGSENLDELIQGYNEEINYIYGPPGSGKTTLCILACISLLNQNRKVIFIDTEGGFYIDRFKQLAKANFEKLMDNLLLIRVKSFDEQVEKLNNLKKLKTVGLVIIDSLGKFYREEVKKEHKEVNEKLVEHLNDLREITKNNIPVILTNQVYSDIEKNKIVPVGGEMVKKFCKKIIELRVKPRILLQIKPEEKYMEFKIEENGISRI